jgi:hypothetical protein
MLGLSVFAGLVVAWWMFPLGLLFWFIMVLNVARDPSLRISHKMQSRAPLAQRFQRYFDRIERAQVSIFNSLSSAHSRTRKILQPVQEETDNLTAQVYALCRRMTALENYRLVTEANTNLQADLQRITDAIDNAGDVRVKEEYEESRRALLERIAKLKLVSTDLDRVEAQLMSLANEMDGVVTEVIRLQASGPDEAERQVPALVSKIRERSDELKQSEREAAEV